MKIDVKKAFNKKRIIAIAAIFVLVVVMIASNPDLNELLSKTEAVKLNFQTGVEYDMVNYGNEILLVNNEGIYAIDKSGREAWSIVSATTSPYVYTSGNYIMLADINGKSVKTFQKEKTIAQIKTENEILCAKMNKNGSIAVATDELGYKGMVILFDKDGTEKFRWHSGTGYIGDIDISSKGKLAVAQLMTDKEAIYSKIVLIDPNSEEEPQCIAELEGIAMKLKYRSNDSLTAVTDKGVYGFKRSGKPGFSVAFNGRAPIECNIENQDNMIFAFDSGLNSTVLESYSSNGTLRGTYDAKSEIRAIDANGECIIAANRDGIVRISPKGTVKNEIKGSKDAKAVKIFSGRSKILVLGDSSAEIMKIK